MLRRLSGNVWVGLGLTAAVFVLYAVTLMPGVPPTDSGEMALAAWLPGIAHAPGFPLYVVLGWLWTHLLPVGRVIWRLNLLSAACGALAVGLTYALAWRTLRVGAGFPSLTKTRRESTRVVDDGLAVDAGKPAPTMRWRVIAAAAVGALALGLGRTAWGWATVAEVYALNLALTAAILLLVVGDGGGSTQAAALAAPPTRSLIESRTRKTKPAQAGATRRWEARQEKPAGIRRPPSQPALEIPRATPHVSRLTFDVSRFTLPLAAFLFGLALGNHLTSIALLAPAIACWLTIRYGWRFWWSKTVLVSALALIAGAAIYLYLPLRAAADPLLNWGQPDTWQRFWWHVTARQYRVSLLSAPVWPQVVQAAQLWWTQCTPPGLALLAVGVWQTVRRRRPLFWVLLLIVVCTTLYAWAYVIEDDGDAYYLPAFLAGAVWVAWGAQAVVRWLTGSLASSRRGIAVAVALSLLVPAVALAMNWRACDRHADTISEDYVRDAFAEIGPNGLLLTRDWQLYAPALYEQRVEGLRPDLTVIDTELLRRGWYFDLLHATASDLMTAVAAEERRFLALRDAWEQGALPDGDPRIAQLQAAYVALLDGFMRQADAAGRPVHVGPNRGAEPLRAATLAGQPDMEPGVGRGWRWTPVGLSFRATPLPAPAVATPPPAPPGGGERLAPLAWRTASFRRVTLTAPERKVQASRADMAALRGLYQAQGGNLAGAEADWLVALAVDPAHGPARQFLERLKGTR